jgi:AcrR family transcriptional regulator
VRAATVEEIKRLAWVQVAAGGALGVSLRGIARDMGMTSSALYRYFSSHEELLSELVLDGFVSLADALETAEVEMPADLGALDRWLTIARAHRQWALEHSAEYALIFGTPMPGGKKTNTSHDEHRRGVEVLFRVMLVALDRGELDPADVPPLSAALDEQLMTWQTELGLPLTAESLAGCLFVWTQLHGAVSLELFGQLPEMLMPAGELFDQHMRTALMALGCTSEPSV